MAFEKGEKNSNLNAIQTPPFYIKIFCKLSLYSAAKDILSSFPSLGVALNILYFCILLLEILFFIPH